MATLFPAGGPVVQRAGRRLRGETTVRDHARILGTLFIGWAALQVVTFLMVLFMPELERPEGVLFPILTAVIVVAYGWVGLRLREGDPRARTPAIILSAVALLSIPIGTALGIYGLWALLRSPKEVEST